MSTKKLQIIGNLLKIDETLTQSGKAADAKTVGEAIDQIQSRTVCPDDYTGSDTEKLQACLDALVDVGGVISINRTYVLENNLEVRHNSNSPERIYLRGVGFGAGINFAAHSIIGSSEGTNFGNIVFDGLFLQGTVDEQGNGGIMIDASRLIRMYVNNCTINGFKHIAFASDHYIQTVYLDNCLIRNVSGAVIKSQNTHEDPYPFNGVGRAYDVKITNCVAEWCHGLFDVAFVYGCSITNNCIEGFSGIPIIVQCEANGLNVSSNYFEQNGKTTVSGTIIYKATIDLSNATRLTMNISDNSFLENNGVNIILLPANNPTGYLTICGNSADGANLLSAPTNASTLENVYVFGNTGNIGNTASVKALTPKDITGVLARVNDGVVTKSASGNTISLLDASQKALSELVLYGKTTQDGTPTESAPVVPVSIEGESVSVEGEVKRKIDVISTTKNIFGGDALKKKLVEIQGNWGNTGDGETVIYNSSKAAGAIIFDAFEPNTQYTIMLYGKCNWASDTVYPTNIAIKYKGSQSVTNLVFEKAPKNTETWCVFHTAANKSVEFIRATAYAGQNTFYYNKCGIFEGIKTVDDFEKYDYNGFTFSFNEGDKLRGIPASDGSNNTDTYGEKWISDEVNFAAGKIIRRCGEINEYDQSVHAETITGAYISSTGTLSDGATVVYALSEPFEENLTDEQKNAYYGFRTCHPYTTVRNSAGANMWLRYTAIDSVEYIEKTCVSKSDYKAIQQEVDNIQQSISNIDESLQNIQDDIDNLAQKSQVQIITWEADD